MAERTGIKWTRSSWSPWIGCTEVSLGCNQCYARALDIRHRYGGTTHWGAGVPRHHTSVSYWQTPLRWNKIAAMEKDTGSCAPGSGRHGNYAMGIDGDIAWHTPGFWPVFPSMCDPFDNEVPEEWRQDFWELIENTPNLTYLLLSKRIGNAEKMLPRSWGVGDPKCNVWLGASVVNQEEADRDIPKLLAMPAVKRFVSYEPALSAVNWTGLLGGISQIIVGGESRQAGAGARPFDLDWARSTIRQCRESGAACFVKQLGSNCGLDLRTKAGSNPEEWPNDLRVQEFPK